MRGGREGVTRRPLGLELDLGAGEDAVVLPTLECHWLGLRKDEDASPAVCLGRFGLMAKCALPRLHGDCERDQLLTFPIQGALLVQCGAQDGDDEVCEMGGVVIELKVTDDTVLCEVFRDTRFCNA